jgi:hypothetical protein
LQKRVKVEFQDGTGTKYSLAVEGRISREKVLKIMDLMELVEGNDGIEEPAMDESTTFGQVFKIIEGSYAGKEFSSADIARDYEDQHGQPIVLSTVSTYLSRFAEGRAQEAEVRQLMGLQKGAPGAQSGTVAQITGFGHNY